MPPPVPEPQDASPSLTPAERSRVKELASVLDFATRARLPRMTTRQLDALPRLYRYASSLLARLETRGTDPSTRDHLRALLVRAHGVLYAGLDRPREPALRRFFDFTLHECPRAVRAEWKLVGATFVVLYGLALCAAFLVTGDLALAYSLLDPRAVDAEINQLRAVAPGEPFRGNFTFGLSDSSGAAGAIMGNNLRVAALFFVSGLIPPLYLLVLATNGLMLGTYTAVAGHWDQAGSISSILWCHGVLEMQSFVLAGSAGMILLRAWVTPGPFRRSHAMQRERHRAWRVAFPALPMLVAAGLIEGFVSPHASFGVRVAVAAGSGLLLVAWIGFGGRERPDRVVRIAG